MRKKGPFQDFFWAPDLGLDRLGGLGDRGEVGVLVVVGEEGGLIKGGNRGVGL